MSLRLALCLVLLAGYAPLAGQATASAQFADVFEWTRSIELQHTDDAITFRPRIISDPMGGWIVFDTPEGQVRLHGRDGSLKAYFGRIGEGPGEFSKLASVLRAESGELLTVDMKGRFARWSTDGARMIVEFRLPLNGISGAQWLGGDSLLVLTPPVFSRGGGSGPVLHVVDVQAGQLVRSFYEPVVPENARNAWVTIIGGSIAASEDAIAVTLPLLDSLVVLTRQPASVRRIPLRVLGRTDDIPDARVDRTAFLQWARNTRVVGLVSGIARTWLVPLLPVGRANDVVDLLVIGLAGGTHILVPNAPVVLGVDEVAGEIVFDDPDHLDPQYVRTARLKPLNH